LLSLFLLSVEYKHRLTLDALLFIMLITLIFYAAGLINYFKV